MQPRQDPNLTINNGDLSTAVRAGIIDETTAARLVNFVVSSSAPREAEDEQLRLVTGFNDIFVTIGLGLLFGALGFLLHTAAFLPAAVIAWVLAEIFTKRMRMALPSIILLVVFVASVFLGTANLFHSSGMNWGNNLDFVPKWGWLCAALAAALAAAVNWWRFHVPITIAAGVAALVAAVFLAINAVFDFKIGEFGAMLLLPMGLAVFCLAMFFDRQDRTRRTQMSDRAFWLHMLAAPLIVHPVVQLISGGPSNIGGSSAVLIFVLFACLALVALVIDRRALLVSSLLYLIVSLAAIFKDNQHADLSAGISVLVVGGLVLLLSVAWKPLRRNLLPLLPQSLRDLVPLAA